MNNLLLFFAFPIATIILSIVLQKILRNEYLTAGTFFAIYLVLTFSVFDINFLIYAIAYTILAYITALITNIVLNRIEENDTNCSCQNNRVCTNIENRSNEDIINEKMNRNYKYFCRR
ncbi:MAG: YbeF family protein [Clostridia bacterium]|nr:YbeF family protein [Clostridia bacterium]